MEEILFRGKAYALYAQVALFDPAEGSYPDWEVGVEHAVFGPRGVAVATASDIEVEIIVCRGQQVPGKMLCISGEIEIGDQGLLVGNVVSCDLYELAWPPGKAAVQVYVDRGEDANQVVFALTRLTDTSAAA